MRIVLTVFALFFVIVAHAAHLAPWNPDGEGMCFGMSANDDGVVIRRTTADGTDAAIAGYYTMVNGILYDMLTSQGLQAVGVPQDWANGIDAGVSMVGTMGVGAAGRTTGIVAYQLATPCDGNPGGLQEILVPNPQTQIRLQSVMGVNPEF